SAANTATPLPANALTARSCRILPTWCWIQARRPATRWCACPAWGRPWPPARLLQDFADLVLDTGAPPGDAMVRVPGLGTPVAPGSTVGGAMLVNCLKAEVAARLAVAGHPPTVLSAAAV